MRAVGFWPPMIAAIVRVPPSPRMSSGDFPPYEPQPFFGFEVLHESSKSRARVGRITTPHGIIETPGFVPVGTNAALKGVSNEQADAAGVQLMFCNTYHLMVHPGAEVVAGAGGLHSFMGLGPDRPLITDSGGFQVFSLARPQPGDAPELKRRSSKINSENQAQLLRVSEEGVQFRSYFGGETIDLTPESSVDAQKALGADIIIPLDELPPNSIDRDALAASVELSHRWEARSLRRHLADRRQQAMYAVVHGGTDRELRAHSASYLSSLPFDGFAVGGSLGADRQEMAALVEYVLPLLPTDRPNHLLGIADPGSVAHGVRCGVDTFDSCFPTRIARHGTLLTREGNLHIGQGRHKSDHGPIDPTLSTIDASRSYLHHLYRMHEPLYLTLASLHNVAFMTAFMAEQRQKILADEI